MNWQQIQGKWNQAKGQVRQRWGKLTDDEITRTRGERDELIGLIQERYGEAREDINRQIDEWADFIKLS